jgi:hypothetical protein
MLRHAIALNRQMTVDAAAVYCEAQDFATAGTGTKIRAAADATTFTYVFMINLVRKS